MDKFVIEGGRPLTGEVTVSGAKNAVLPILAATLLSSEPYRLFGVPDVRDVATMRQLLRSIGATVSDEGVEVRQIVHCGAPYEWVKTLRAAILVLGPLLARCGEAHVSLPGGCAIGARPVGWHLDALKRMGAEIALEHGIIHAKAARLHGARIDFERVTVTGTENIMMAAALAEGTTVLHNAACEPEVVDLAHFLIQCGAKIQGAGGARITIEGVPRLGGASYRVIPDRIEAATLLIAGAMTQGDLFVRGARVEHLASVIAALGKAGVPITMRDEGMHVRGGGALDAMGLETAPYPDFPTDVGPQMMVLMSRARGISTLHETIFEGRFSHVPELVRMGANIQIEGHRATITGVPRLSGANVMASDLRAGAALMLAGLAAEGHTELSRVYHVDRGYERIEEKLSAVGAHIQRVKA